MKSFSCDEVDISHSKLLELRQAGKLNLGIGQEDAAKIANDPRYAPKTTANAAFKFWNFVTTAGFFYAVYLSFTDAWWWIVIGLFGCMVVFRANKKGHTHHRTMANDSVAWHPFVFESSWCVLGLDEA